MGLCLSDVAKTRTWAYSVIEVAVLRVNVKAQITDARHTCFMSQH